MLSKTNTGVVKALDNNRNCIRSGTGGWRPGEGVFSHGYSMMDDLVGKKNYFKTLILNATGRLVSKDLADWIEAIYCCLSWPDPRIWCNHIGALAGSCRTSVVAGTTLGILANDSKAYGSRTLLDGIDFIQSALLKKNSGLSIDDIIQPIAKAHRGKPKITGYARPLAKGDERLVTMEKLTNNLGFKPEDHLLFAYEIEQYLLKHYDEGMNINGYISAFFCDQGINRQEAYQIFAAMVMSGVTACYIETYNKPVNTFLPLRCSDIDYTGPPKRPVPKNQ
ncbi:MAG: hypothetical protein AAFZ92_09525 [Pseudomonadota bacterium]